MTIDPRSTLADAEQTLIGQMLIDAGVLDEVATTSAEFLDPKAQIAWRTARELHAAGTAPTPLTVADAAPSGYDLLGWLTECYATTLTTANAAYHAEIIRKESLRRRVVLMASTVLGRAKDGDLDGDEIHAMLLSEATGIDPGHTDDGPTSMAILVRQRFDAYAEMAQRREDGDPLISGIPTGLEKLDRVIGGFQLGDLHILGGRPAMGKSAVALGFADACSARDVGAHVFSLEDSAEKYADRSLSRYSLVPINTLRNGGLSSHDTAHIRVAGRELGKRVSWLVDERSGLTASEIVRSYRRAMPSNGTQLVVIDYLQLITHPRAERQDLAVRETLKILADAATDDGVAILLLSQLNRECEKRNDKRPLMSDFRDSGAIEEYSRCILGMYRGSYYGAPVKGIDYDDNEGRPSDSEWESRADLLVLKNNSGETGNVRLRWDGPTTRVY